MRKIALYLVLFSVLIVGNPAINVIAADNNSVGVCTERAADVIEVRYRVNNGIIQYRRWNSTKNCWVDPYWMDVLV